MFKEFKEFAFKGNVLDLAIGVVIGGAFGKIVKAVVDDVVMPAVGILLPSGDWRAAGFRLRGDAKILWGDFLGVTIDFLVVAFVLFLVVRTLNRMKAPPPPANTRECPRCISLIPKKATRCSACTSEIEALAA